MGKHVPVVAYLHIAWSSIGLLGGLFIFALLSNVGLILHAAGAPAEELPEGIFAILPIIATAIGIGAAILSLPGIVGGIGVIRKKEWGRIVLLVVSFFDLLSIPFGTALGIYSIWVLMNDEVVKEFKVAPAPVS